MKQSTEMTKYLQLIIKIGAGILTAILTGFLVGLWIDRSYSLGGIGVVVGVIVGVGIGFVWLFNMVMSIEDEDEDST